MAKKAKTNPIFIASSPNTEYDDLLIALKLLVKPWMWRSIGEHSAFTRFRKTLASYHHVDDAFLYNTGRAALYELLKAMGVGEGDQVILQAFTCVAVPTAILWTKATPVYVDITDTSYNAPPGAIAFAITPQTRAVIIQHTFGELSPILEIKAIIDQHNTQRPQEEKIYLIEDCAHSLGAMYTGKRVGEWGDAAFFSFGQEKVISCTQGGAAIAKAKEIEEQLSLRYKNIWRMWPIAIKRMILHPILWSIITIFYYVPPVTSSLTIGRALILFFRLIGALRPHVDRSARALKRKPNIRKLSNAQTMMLENQFQKLDAFMVHRTELVKTYSAILAKRFTVLQTDAPLIRFPLRLSNPAAFTAAFKKQRIIIGNWYTAPVHPPGIPMENFGYRKGSCVRAENVCKSIVNLPTHIEITPDDAQQIARIAVETQA